MLAPALEVSDWLNTDSPLQLSQLHGKIVVLHAFQMLCPGCVSHGIPQAAEIHELYQNTDVKVIGLHTVFEHHDVMGKDALMAFVHEYQIRFPVAIDKASDKEAIPDTMKNYQLQGTPSLVLIDQQGQVRLKHFGRLSDMQLGNAIGQLLSSKMVKDNDEQHSGSQSDVAEAGCSDDSCPI